MFALIKLTQHLISHYMDLLNNFFGIFKTIIEPLFKANV